MNNKTTKKVKFSPGYWEQAKVPSIFSKEVCVRNKSGVVAILPRPFHYDGQDARFKKEFEEYKSTARLIANAPKMFWILVNRAKETGEQYLFDVISDIVGETITFGDMIVLSEYADKVLKEISLSKKGKIEIFELIGEEASMK